MEKERWKDIPGYEGLYQASNLGRIRSLPNSSRNSVRVLVSYKKKSGYHNVTLCKNKKVKYYRTHRLVALTFLPNPENKEYVNHINGDKSDNRLENLEWVTASENALHAHRVLGIKSNGGCPRKKLRCIETGVEYESLHDTERKTGLKRQALNYCLKHNGTCGGFHWEYVEPESNL